MTIYQRDSDKKKTFEEITAEEEEFLQGLQSNKNLPKDQMDLDKRIRREIANSNERRRMQSINVGFQSLRTLLPHHEGDKLSKAAILQQTRDYISNLEKDKTQLQLQNAQLRQKLKEICPQEVDGISPAPKRKKRDTESSDEGIGLSYDDTACDLIELRKQLEKERYQRLFLEQRMRNLEVQVDGDKVKPATKATNLKVIAEVQETLQQPQTDLQSCVDMREEPAVSTKSEPIDMLPATDEASNAVGEDAAPVFTSPQSKRNLEMIAEAIRHLEGDHLFLDRHNHHIPRGSGGGEEPYGEDSQTESSTSDQEDMKSECSEHDDSPLLSRSPDINVGLTHATATLCVTTHPATRVIGPAAAAGILSATTAHASGVHLLHPQQQHLLSPSLPSAALIVKTPSQ